MKKIEAIIRPSKLKAVQTGLKEAGIPCNTIIPVKGSGLQRTYTERYRGTEQNMILQTRIMLISIVSDDNLVEFMEALDVQNIVTEDELRGIIRISSAKPKKVDLNNIIEKEASGADDS